MQRVPAPQPMRAAADAVPLSATKPGAVHDVAASPRQALQRRVVESVGHSPRQTEQGRAMAARSGQAAGQTGLPAQLKAGIESLSGLSMDGVRVHYNSSAPAQLKAHATTQGQDIHIAPGQEQHLPHEAWHVVQQAQGRVRATVQMKSGVAINDDHALEREADIMGARAMTAPAAAMPPVLSRPQLPASVSQRVVQRAGAGGEKIGFEEARPSDPGEALTIAAGIQLLRGAWDEVKLGRRARKTQLGADMHTLDSHLELEKKRLEEVAALDKATSDKKAPAYGIAKNAINTKYSATSTYLKNNPGGLTKIYADRLDKPADFPAEEALLQTASKFADNTLQLNADQIIYNAPGGAIVIATLRKGKSAFHRSLITRNTPRRVYSKWGFEQDQDATGETKEYVKDNRGAFTRRYAYVEKNYHQMMEFFMTEHLTGRFQQYMMAGGSNTPGIHTFTTQMIKDVAAPTPKRKKMSDTQLAVAHQMYGSLPEQRGVSMTSTPKVGVTYANTGGNFRTPEGFKLKVDLSRVPDDVLLLNHYAQGGVSEMPVKDYSVAQAHKTNKQNIPHQYKYRDSALHARELFVEKIKPAWVVEIQYHAAGGYASRAQGTVVSETTNPVNMFDAARKNFGAETYQKGFAIGLVNGWHDRKLWWAGDQHYLKGKATGDLVRQGHAAGLAEFKKNMSVQPNPVDAFKETVEAKGVRGQFGAYHVGYMLGRRGEPMIKSPSEFKTLLSGNAVPTPQVVYANALSKWVYSWWQ